MTWPPPSSIFTRLLGDFQSQVLEYDRKTGHFYYFNTQTGESLWAEEADAEDPGEGKTGNDHVAVENYQQQQQHQTDDGSGMKRRGVKGEMGGGPTPYGDEVEDEVAEEGDNTIMLEASRHGAEVYKRTQAVVMAFTGTGSSSCRRESAVGCSTPWRWPDSWCCSA